MKSIKVMLLITLGYLLAMQHVLAQAAPGDCSAGTAFDPSCFPPSVPAIDGSGAIIAPGLVIGLAALVREKFHE